MHRVKCPCCGFPTLEQRGDFEICRLCNWEDDGQDDPNADKVSGGPNGDYSLTEARINFKKHYIMYRDKKNIVDQSMKEIETKKNLIRAFEKLNELTSEDTEEIWNEIKCNEWILDSIVYGRSRNNEKAKEILNQIQSHEKDKVVEGLLSLRLDSKYDYSFAEDTMVHYSKFDDEDIRATAIHCFGQIARMYGDIDKELVLPIIELGLRDRSSFVREQSRIALEDIHKFCK